MTTATATATKPKTTTEKYHLTVRHLTTRASTIDLEQRSIEAVLATENRVTVLDPLRYEPIDEILLMSGLERPERLPLLEDHAIGGLKHLLGSVRKFRFEGNRFIGRLFVADGPPASTEDRAWRMIRQGHLTDVSIGYRYLSKVDISPGRSETVNGVTYTAGRITLRVVTGWQTRELSLTIFGADSDAKIRAERERMIARGNSHHATAGVDVGYIQRELRKMYAEDRAKCAERRADILRRQVTAALRAAHRECPIW